MPPPAPPPHAHTQHALYAYHAAPVHTIDYHYLPPSHSAGVADANRPKSEEEKRARTLDSKRRWARKHRAGGGDVKPKAESGIFSVPSAAEGSLNGGSVGTPASEGEEEDGQEEADSSFEMSGEWAEGVRGGSVPVFHHHQQQHHPYAVASNPFYPTSAGPSIYGRTPTKSAVPVPGSGLIDPYLASRPPLRSTSSMPPAYPSPDVVDGAAEALHLPQHYGGSASAHLLYQQSASTSAATNPYSQPFQSQLVAQEQPHPASGYPILHHPRGVDEEEDEAEELDDPHRRLNPSLLSAAPPRRPNSQPHVITAGQPAPVALPYFARRQSPARLLTTNLNGAVSGIAAGIPAPREKAEPSANGLESPVKLRRTGTNGKGKEPIHARQPAAHREDAAGILLALKAGPSSPMGPLVQSPVSSRGRSESPAPNLNSTSSGEGSTAAAHALLATAKKAHAYATTLPSSAAGPGPRGWGHEMSLVATPTPGNLMRIAMESSPVVRFGAAGAAVGADSEGDLIVGEEDEGEDAFTSSSGGGRRPRRGRSISPSSQKGGRRRGGGAGSSSSGGGAASSSSQPRPLHHHHPVGLTSELGDFDLEPPSSASIPRTHHHHDPLRELDAAMQPHPGSSSSVVSHLATPAPAGSSTAMRTSSSADAISRHATHPHDPFLVAGASAAIPTTATNAAVDAVSRTSSPPGAFSSFLFSSPAHPQFSKTLGLTAAPGPGVLYTGVGGETPARGGLGPHAGGALAAVAGLGGRHSRAREISAEEELMVVAARERERIEAMKTPVTARVGLEGVIGRRNGMPPSDLESNEEEGSEVTGTPGRESQSPGKTTVDEDDDEDGSLDD
ncbi:Proteophosphoglycan ppg4 [Rhodotorula toruloides ATCC 204091]|uniref:BY PROTMAP: gi/342321058/gb/EGU12996.1/ Proteophosphoglycan ppg4 [Rhodotorula glutinis ATCC 204091] n=1 Tax=Rhodotorula toruloides TaxID=5286 RepID=A0A0K3CF68_RHOTO|nr:Proteophosphoglycan ppg4 [Rhodotorula toruloides ATCC 204091]